jgi:two-component system, OmpR family, phosphate regulon sensor histidine kinase PhoR
MDSGSLDAMARDAQRASDFHAVLLAMAAHDMRQPLQSILSGYCWLANRQLDQRGRLYVEHGRQAIEQLADQLDRLVEALRVHEGAACIMHTPVNLQNLFSTLQRDNTVFASRKGVDLRIARADAMVMSDATLLDSILRNLVRNALKYTSPGGRVLIGCRRRGPRCRIEVHDTGRGIPSDHQAQIFEAFRRMDSGTSDGLGLGLFVVRRAADLLGHKIEVRSEVGRGSCFSILTRAAGVTANTKTAISYQPSR